MPDVPFWPALPYWPALIFWSAIVLGLVASGVGLRRQRPPLLIGGAMLMLPASLYLTATPRFQYVGWVPVACRLEGARLGKARRRLCPKLCPTPIRRQPISPNATQVSARKLRA